MHPSVLYQQPELMVSLRKSLISPLLNHNLSVPVLIMPGQLSECSAWTSSSIPGGMRLREHELPSSSQQLSDLSLISCMSSSSPPSTFITEQLILLLLNKWLQLSKGELALECKLFSQPHKKIKMLTVARGALLMW